MAVLDGRPLLLDYYYVAFRITRVKREWQKSDAGARETNFSFQPLREKPDFYDQRHSHTTNKPPTAITSEPHSKENTSIVLE